MAKLKQMNKEQLIDYAAKKGYRLDPGMNVEKMRDAVQKTEKAELNQAKTETEKSAARYAKAHSDSLMLVKFTNMQDPGADIQFTLDATRAQPFKFHLYDGQTYRLPSGVIDHINSTTYPTSQNIQDPGSGQVRTRTVQRNRASCIPVSVKQPQPA